MQMHNRLGSWVTLPCHIHLGGALKMIKIGTSTHNQGKVNDHTLRIDNVIIQANIKVEYDQAHDHTSISHTNT